MIRARKHMTHSVILCLQHLDRCGTIELYGYQTYARCRTISHHSRTYFGIWPPDLMPIPKGLRMITKATEKAIPSPEVAERLPLPEPSSQPVKSSLNPRQKKFLKNYLEEGMSATDAYQKAYGCKRDSARFSAAILLSTNPNIIAKVEAFVELEQKATKRALYRKSERAAEVLGEALEAADTNARIRAAKELLDRTGHKPKDEIDLTTKSDLNIRLTLPEDLDIDDVI